MLDAVAGAERGFSNRERSGSSGRMVGALAVLRLAAAPLGGLDTAFAAARRPMDDVRVEREKIRTARRTAACMTCSAALRLYFR
jgi:hypothetical protein